MVKKIEIGEVVTVKVSKILSFGLQVTLPDGRRGTIREREISWQADERRKWHTRYALGDFKRAMIIHEEENNIELSIRMAQENPWLNAKTDYPVGKIVPGVVTGVTLYGVFVLLESGITGLLHSSEIPQKYSTDLLWVGDHLQVRVVGVALKRRRIRLTLKNLEQARWQQRHFVSNEGERYEAPALENSESLPETSHFLLSEIEPLSILIIEDQQPQREAVANWFGKSQRTVKSVESAEEGLGWLSQNSADLVLSDLELPNMNGLRAIAQIQEKWPHIDCVLMTDWTKADEYVAEIEELRQAGVRLLIKPFFPEDLSELFISKPEFDWVPNFQREHIPIEIGAEESLKSNLHDSKSHILQHLKSVKDNVKALKVVLFRLDPYQRQIHIDAQAGSGSLSHDALPNLIYSPVRDVADDGQVVIIENSVQMEKYVRNLSMFLEFGSCLGLRLPSELIEPHALFIFFTQTRKITQSERLYGEAAALSIAAILEKELFLQQNIKIQRDALLGMMMRALVHEVNNRVGPINFLLEDLREQSQTLWQTLIQKPEEMEQRVEASNTTLEQIHENLTHLARTTRLFGRMALQDQNELVLLSELLQECQTLSQDIAGRANVKIELYNTKDFLLVTAKRTQLQQVLLNVLLNAIQHIERRELRQGGTIYIWTEQIEQKDQKYNCIYIEDDGPGIHKAWWEQIFEPGFTTRKGEGSGMGLHIARRLVEDLGGTIKVVNSAMLWGTTIEIQLIAHTWQENNNVTSLDH